MEDAEITFMHPHGPTRSFTFPHRVDKCLIPLEHILCVIKMPSTETGCQYNVNHSDNIKVHKQSMEHVSRFVNM